MNDEERRVWLLGEIASNVRAHVNDQDHTGREHKARAVTFIDAGVGLDLFNRDEGQRLLDAVESGITDWFEIRALLDRGELS